MWRLEAAVTRACKLEGVCCQAVRVCVWRGGWLGVSQPVGVGNGHMHRWFAGVRLLHLACVRLCVCCQWLQGAVGTALVNGRGSEEHDGARCVWRVPLRGFGDLNMFEQFERD